MNLLKKLDTLPEDVLNAIVKGLAVNNFEELFSNLGINRIRLKRIFIDDDVTLVFLYNLMQKMASAYVEPEEKVQAMINLLNWLKEYGVEVQVPEIDIEEGNIEDIVAKIMEALEVQVWSEVVPSITPTLVDVATSTGVVPTPTVTSTTTTTTTTTVVTTAVGTEFNLPPPPTSLLTGLPTPPNPNKPQQPKNPKKPKKNSTPSASLPSSSGNSVSGKTQREILLV